MALNEFYRTSAIYSHPNADGEVVNVVDYELTTIGTPSSEIVFCGELATEVGDAIVTGYLPQLSLEWSLKQVNCFNIDQPAFSAEQVFGNPGASGSDSLPLRSSVVVKKSTGLRGRSFNGRMFLPATTELEQDDGIITPALKAIIQLFVDDLIILTSPASNQWTMAVYSSLLSDGTVVQNMLVRDTLGTIRGRQKV